MGPSPRRSSPGFSGFGVAARTFLIVAVAGLLPAGLELLRSEDEGRAVERQEAELRALQEAALSAHEALEAIAASAPDPALRAAERALHLATEAGAGAEGEATPLRPGELVGRLEVRARAVHGLEALGLAAGSSLAEALPELLPALRSGQASIPRVVRRGQGALALGPATSEGRRAVVFVPDELGAMEALQRARANLGSVISAERPPLRAWPAWWAVAAALLAALLAATWSARRLARPLEDALAAMEAYLAGDHSARPDPARGAPEARAAALGLARLVAQLEHERERLDLAGAEELERAAAAVLQLAKGGRMEGLPAFSGPLASLGSALQGAEGILRSRLERLSAAALSAARAVAAGGEGAGRLSARVQDQAGALRRFSEGADAAAERAAAAEAQLGATALALEARAITERARLQRAREAVLALQRRVAELEAGAARADTLLLAADALEGTLAGIGRLSRRGAGEGGDAVRLAAKAGEARAGLERLRGELAAQGAALRDARDRLASLAESWPSASSEPEPSLTAPLFEAAGAASRAAELAAVAIRNVEASARGAAEDAEAVKESARLARASTGELAQALVELELSDPLELELLRRLEALGREVEEARARGALTAEGAQAVEEVARAAELARGRVARLAGAVESAAATLRT
jgi:hypothetical protein